MFKNKTFIPWLIAIAAVAATIAIFLSGAAQAPDAVGDNTAVVTTVTYAESIEASGSIQAQSFARLAWKTGGTVGSVFVQVGDTVQAGDVLLSLDLNSASANIISAQADLQNAQNQLNALTTPDGKTRADAQKSLFSALNAWDGARSELSKTLSTLETYGDSRKYADLIQASEDLTDTLAAFALPASPDAQWYYWAARMESLARSGDYDFPALAAQLRSPLTSDQADLVDEIVSAQNSYEQALVDFSETISTYQVAADLSLAVAVYQQSAETLLNTSQAAYETLVMPNPADISAAQAKVDAVQATINSLQVTAPFAGEVLAIEQQPGDVVSAGMLAVVLADRSGLYLDTQVDEADISHVAPGNLASLTLDALPDVTLQGRVTYINPVSELASGLVKYSVRIELEPGFQTMLLGATADVIIQISQPQSVLAVPVSAVQSDKTGEYVTRVISDGSSQRVGVESGESFGDLVIVSGDLQLGDRVLIDYQSNIQSPNPLGGN